MFGIVAIVIVEVTRSELTLRLSRYRVPRSSSSDFIFASFPVLASKSLFFVPVLNFLSMIVMLSDVSEGTTGRSGVGEGLIRRVK